MNKNIWIQRFFRIFFLNFYLLMLLSSCGGVGSDNAKLPSDQSLAAVSSNAEGSVQIANAQVDQYIQAQIIAQRMPGVSLVVIKDGVVIYAKAYGYANVEQAKTLHPEQRFSIGSLTKQFVAAAVMLLVEDGKLGLDQPISEFIGVVPASWSSVSVRHLLNHTSGLPIDPPNDYLLSLNSHAPYRDDELLDIFKTLNLQTSPGKLWSYSNVGYDILGLLIAKVTGKPYASFLQERIFTPLGMSSARTLGIESSTNDYASGYLITGDQRVQSIQTNAWIRYGAMAATGISVSAIDLAKWDAALYGEKILKKSSIDQMFAISTLAQAKTRVGAESSANSQIPCARTRSRSSIIRADKTCRPCRCRARKCTSPLPCKADARRTARRRQTGAYRCRRFRASRVSATRSNSAAASRTAPAPR